jgi:uncharacterized protein YllA (UPF0747 family)
MDDNLRSYAEFLDYKERTLWNQLRTVNDNILASHDKKRIETVASEGSLEERIANVSQLINNISLRERWKEVYALQQQFYELNPDYRPGNRD